MRLLAKEEKSQPSPEIEKARRLALAVVDAEKRLNVLRSSFQEEKEELGTRLAEIRAVTEKQEEALKTEVLYLEERRRQALRPVTEESKRAAAKMEEADKKLSEVLKSFRDIERKETILSVQASSLDEREKQVSALEAVVSEMFLLTKRRKSEDDESRSKENSAILRIREELSVRENGFAEEAASLASQWETIKAEFQRLEREKASTLAETDRLVEERKKLGAVIGELKLKGLWHQAS